MSKFMVGQTIRVKSDAFAKSSDPTDFEVRGKLGMVRTCNTYKAGYYQVDIEGLGLYYLKESEMETV